MFWWNPTYSLQLWGFKINLYGWCVAKKIVNNKQLTVVWHVDDLKTSHVDNGEVEELITQLIVWYWKGVGITVYKVKAHDYLGMDIYYWTQEKVKIEIE